VLKVIDFPAGRCGVSSARVFALQIQIYHVQYGFSGVFPGGAIGIKLKLFLIVLIVELIKGSKRKRQRTGGSSVEPSVESVDRVTVCGPSTTAGFRRKSPPGDRIEPIPQGMTSLFSGSIAAGGRSISTFERRL